MANNPRLAMPALNLYGNVVKASQGIFFANNEDLFDKAIFHRSFDIVSASATITDNQSKFSIVGDSLIITFSFAFTTDADIGAIRQIVFVTQNLPSIDTTNKGYLKYFVMVQEGTTDFLEARIALTSPAIPPNPDFSIRNLIGNYVPNETYIVKCYIQCKLPE